MVSALLYVQFSSFICHKPDIDTKSNNSPSYIFNLSYYPSPIFYSTERSIQSCIWCLRFFFFWSLRQDQPWPLRRDLLLRCAQVQVFFITTIVAIVAQATERTIICQKVGQPRTESMDMLPPVRVLQEKQDPRFSITKPTKTKVWVLWGWDAAWMKTGVVDNQPVQLCQQRLRLWIGPTGLPIRTSGVWFWTITTMTKSRLTSFPDKEFQSFGDSIHSFTLERVGPWESSIAC